MIALQVFNGQGEPATREKIVTVPEIGVIQEWWLDDLKNYNMGLTVRLQIQAHEFGDWRLGSSLLCDPSGQPHGMAPVFFRDGDAPDLVPSGVTHHKVHRYVGNGMSHLSNRAGMYVWEQWHITYRGMGR